ncbi:MAG: nucleoside-triphosphatase [Planctomycetota bacterium]|jgi:nucleoside-triphosphatase THEP1
MKKSLVLWVGPKHSGKTTTVGELARKAKNKGVNVAGVLAPSVYDDEHLAGFEVVDLRTGKRLPLAARKINQNQQGGFNFTQTGLEFGKNALSIEAIKSAELIIVDEFGPLELQGQGWRKDIDLILSNIDALIVLVVRNEIAEKVQSLYKNVPAERLDADKGQSIVKVMEMLADICKLKNDG